MARGFYQVLIAPEDREKTTVVTPFGKFMFNVMPFGLRNTPATFQRLMDDVLRDSTNFVLAYIDDVAIFSMSWTEHPHHLRRVLGLLKDEGLTIQPQKTQLATQTCKFLGHTVGHNAISPLGNQDRSGEGVPPTYDQNWCQGIPRVVWLLSPIHQQFQPPRSTAIGPD